MLPVISELLDKAVDEKLYKKIIKQLNKDFLLANIQYNFPETLTPLELKKSVITILNQLIITEYDSYLNLIYRIDISEKELKAVGNKILPLILQDITYLILKREYQKVWFKNALK